LLCPLVTSEKRQSRTSADLISITLSLPPFGQTQVTDVTT
jgi:hypothetical protein